MRVVGSRATAALLAGGFVVVLGSPPVGAATTADSLAFAYVSVRNNAPQVYLKEGHAAERVLTFGDAASQPAWSPDGKRLAYVGYGGGKATLHLLDVGGAPARRLTDGDSLEYGAAWSPDGKSLAYFSTGAASGKTTLVIRDLASGKTVTIATEGQDLGPGAPDWSADGERLVFVGASKGNRRDAFVVSADGTGLRNVSGSIVQRSVGGAALSPDGRTLLFVADMREHGRDLISVDLESGVAKNLTEGTGAHNVQPRWSADGRRVLFASSRDDPQKNRSDIFVMNADGTGLRNLTRSPHEDLDPRWSADGRSAIFTSLRNGNAQIYAVDVESGATRQLTHSNSQDFEQAPRPVALR